MNSNICRHTHWYENQSWSGFFDNSMPNVLLQNAVNSGFSGGSCSKNEYNFSNVERLPTNRSINVGTSLVNISHAIFGCLKRSVSLMSFGGSVVINVTNSSIISVRCKLYHWLIDWLIDWLIRWLDVWREIGMKWKEICISNESSAGNERCGVVGPPSLTIGLSSCFDIYSLAVCPHRPAAL